MCVSFLLKSFVNCSLSNLRKCDIPRDYLMSKCFSVDITSNTSPLHSLFLLIHSFLDSFKNLLILAVDLKLFKNTEETVQ